MKSILLLIIKWVAILAIAFFLFILFFPVTYQTAALKERTGTKYWNLATGSRIAYTMIPAKGIKKTYPIIYLHGGPGAGITDLEIKTLGVLADDGYDVYLYDQAGCGHSGRFTNIKEYNTVRHVKDLDEIIYTIKADKVILIAQSWGSILATLYLADHPDRVAKLAITAPAPIQPRRNELEKIPAPDSLHLATPYMMSKNAEENDFSFRTRTTMYLAKKFGMKFESDKEGDEFAGTYTTELNKTQVCDSSKAVRSEGTEGFYVNYMTRLSLGQVKDPRTRIKNLPLPVLIMKAQCDNQPWGYATEYLELFPNHQFVLVPLAGHNIFIEQPALYIQTIRQFLKN